VRDIQAALAFARDGDVQTRVRSGGHSTEGYSTVDGGLVLDLSLMNQVRDDRNQSHISVQAGASWADVYTAVARSNRSLVGGACGTVCIGGFVQGGGWGFLSRQYGLAIDNLESVDVVSANGTLELGVSRQHRSDLFWAISGGGGGNWGVLTALTLRVQAQTGRVWFGKIRYSFEHAEQALRVWQSQFCDPGSAPRKLSLMLDLCYDQGAALPHVEVVGMLDSQETNALSLALAPFHAIPHLSSQFTLIEYSNHSAAYDTMSNFMSYPVGWREKKTSGFASTNLDDLTINATLKMFARSPSWLNHIVLEPWGGAIAEVSRAHTAFYHRSTLLDFTLIAIVDPAAGTEAQISNRHWAEETWSAVRGSGCVGGASGSYVNYIDRDLEEWEWGYYGKNWNRLVQVKNRYDPTNFFHFEQSVDNW
jgi:FAD/FMN-containing dehydrogenase